LIRELTYIRNLNKQSLRRLIRAFTIYLMRSATAHASS